jgi:ABC-type antimicrobial peptide transport system permease subunit
MLAAIGIYGLVSYWVTQRTYEIGVRVAIGAPRQRIVSMIMGQGLRVALYGIGAGVIAALALTRFLASLLYGDGLPRLEGRAHRSGAVAAGRLTSQFARAGASAL